jgi:hypothetical protein
VPIAGGSAKNASIADKAGTSEPHAAHRARVHIVIP